MEKYNVSVAKIETSYLGEDFLVELRVVSQILAKLKLELLRTALYLADKTFELDAKIGVLHYLLNSWSGITVQFEYFLED